MHQAILNKKKLLFGHYLNSLLYVDVKEVKYYAGWSEQKKNKVPVEAPLEKLYVFWYFVGIKGL